ncbi:MAG: hypothetical protein ACE5OO_00980 [Candidatus Bathyarchaeia archaeon]
MYPETDVVSIPITPERLERLKAALPEMPEEKLRRIRAEYRLNEKLGRQVVDSDYLELFEEVAKETQASPTLIAVTLTETFKSLEREGVRVDLLTDEAVLDAFRLLDEGLTAKESLPEIFTWLAAHADGTPREALDALGLGLIPSVELRRLVEEKVEANRELIERMGERALGPLMGMVMGEVRGRARAQCVQTLLREALGAALSSLRRE